LNVKHIALGDYNAEQLVNEQYLLLITATQGEGEVPEEAFNFYDMLFSEQAPSLAQLKFAVFGLGDSSYEYFCQAGRCFDQRLAELGAQRFLAREDGDVDYTEQARQWRQKVVNYLQQQNINIIP